MEKNYEVLDITERQQLSPSGGLEKVYNFKARTAKGTIFTLQAPEAMVSTDEVKAALGAKATRLDSLKG